MLLVSPAALSHLAGFAGARARNLTRASDDPVVTARGRFP